MSVGQASSAGRRPALLARGLLLEYLTVGWNVVEGVIAILAGILSGSVVLIGFGVDSFVESLSGGVLMWRLRAEQTGATHDRIEVVERRAERLVGVLFLVLAVYVSFEALRSLMTAAAPEASPVGIGLTLVSIVVMLWLARAKRRVGEALGSRALIADAMQTLACWYLSAVALAGLLLNALFGWWWADPVAALAIAVLLVREGLEAIRGEDHLD
jgi:cation diffusion facilitator family transporter